MSPPTLQSALALHQSGRLAEAEAAYCQLLEMQPSNHQALYLLGVLQQATNRHARAADLLLRAAGIATEWYQPPHALAASLIALGHFDEAAAASRRAIALQPGFAEAHVNLANALHSLGQYSEAMAELEKALALKPALTAAHVNRAAVQRDAGDLAGAQATFRHALSLNPRLPAALSGLGAVLREQGDLAGAIAAQQQALALAPGFRVARSNLALALAADRQFELAFAEFDALLAEDPQDAQIHVSRAAAWIVRGDFARGWPEYEWRAQATGLTRRTFPQRRWSGEPLAGKTLLLHAE